MSKTQVWGRFAAGCMRRAPLVLAAIGLLTLGRACGEEPGRPLVVAHRGLLRHAPENTLTNFAACLALRLGFEMDVRRSKDGQLVAVHDEMLKRTTNGQGAVASMTLDQLKRLDAGKWFRPEFAGQRIPAIDEIFALVARHGDARVLIAVDLKVADAEVEADVVRLAEKHKVLDRLLFIGRAISVADVRKRLRQASKDAHVACVANSPDEFADALADRDADWVYVRYVPSEDEAARVHTAGKKVFIAGSTVAGRMPKNWRTAASRGVDAILTDYALELNGSIE